MLRLQGREAYKQSLKSLFPLILTRIQCPHSRRHCSSAIILRQNLGQESCWKLSGPGGRSKNKELFQLGGGGGSSPYLVVPFLFDKFLISISF